MARTAVIIPAHNAAATIASTLRSVLAQSSPADEIIVIDDRSTDATAEIVVRLARSTECRVHLVQSDAGNAATSRNLGALATEAERLVFVDADDLLGPDTLRALGAALDLNPLGVAFAPWYRLDPDGDGWRAAPPSCRPRRSGEAPIDAWLRGWYHPPASVMWSRAAFERAGRFQEGLVVNQDGDLMMRALASGVEIEFAQSGAVFYRRHATPRSTVSGLRTTRDGLLARLDVLDVVADRLAQAGRRSHRSAVRAAYDQIATDAATCHLDLVAVADALARPRLPAQLRAPIRRIERWIDGYRRSAGRSEDAPSPPSPPATDPPPAGERLRHGPACTAAVERPTVSVIVPTYQRAHLVVDAIESILDQTFTDLEVLVIDDGSTDATDEAVRSIGDPRVRYVRQFPNAGVAAARNRGLRESRGRYLAFLDSDDTWFPDKLARQLELFACADARVGLVYGGVAEPTNEGWQNTRPMAHGDVYPDMLVRNVIHGGGSNVVIPREVVARVGFFDESLPAIEDYDYWLRVARRHHVDAVDAPVMRYENPAGPVRKSLDVHANHEGRRMFHERHRQSMRSFGREHLFLSESARRLITLPPTDRRRAVVTALRAVRAQPTAGTPWRVLARTAAPAWLHDAIASRRRRARTSQDGLSRIMLYSPTPYHDSGGVQNTCATLAAGLRTRGHRVIQRWSSVPDDAVDEVPALPLPLPEFGRGWRFPATTMRSIRCSIRLLRELWIFRPGVVDVHYLDPSCLHFLVWRPLFGYRLVLSAHGSDVLMSRSGRSERALRRLVRCADAVTAVSDSLAERVASYPGMDRDDIEVVVNGIDLDFWAAGSGDEGVRSRRIVCVGRLEWVKAHDILIAAMKTVVAQVPDVELVIVGDGSLRNPLRELAENSGVRDHIRFVGQVPSEEVRDLLASAAVFVLPSRSEGMPVALLEAMATSTAVVATEVGAVAAVVGDDCGRLIAPEDEAGLAHALVEVLRDPAEASRFARAAARRARDFTADEMIDRYAQILGGEVGARSDHGRASADRCSTVGS